MLSLLNESISNASFGIYSEVAGTIYECCHGAVSWLEVVIGYVAPRGHQVADDGLLILVTARVFVPYEIAASGLDACASCC